MRASSARLKRELELFLIRETQLTAISTESNAAAASKIGEDDNAHY
jgi:hypothetical protein